MRNFQTLDTYAVESDLGILYLSSSAETIGTPKVSMRREGGYMSISVSYGPLEIALRPRFVDLARTLHRLRPVQGLQTTRQVGSAQAYIALGLREDGSLVMRPTLVSDATGLMVYNLLLTDPVREALYAWLPVDENAGQV